MEPERFEGCIQYRYIKYRQWRYLNFNERE